MCIESELWLGKVLWKIPLNIPTSEPKQPGTFVPFPYTQHATKKLSHKLRGQISVGETMGLEAKKETEITELNLVSSASDKHPGF